MADAPYELLALGLRYWFVLLLVATLARAVWLMWGERREYNRALKRLPDAGLVGEVVELNSGKSQPLPREGLIGSGRGCDIRFPGLHRREMEFVFRPGLGLKLIPIHRNHQSILDGEPLNKADSFALHGTVLQLRSLTLRFRLFAGLDLPYREAVNEAGYFDPAFSDADSDSPWDAVPAPGMQPGFYANEPVLEQDWQYALPNEYLNPPQSPAPGAGSQSPDAYHPGETP